MAGKFKLGGTPVPDVTNSAELKKLFDNWKRSRIPTYGYFAEFVYARVLEQEGRTVEPVHSEGVDFLVDGHRRVDVKSRVQLDSDAGRNFTRQAPGYRKDGVEYHYVLFLADRVEILDDDEEVITALDWEAVFADHWTEYGSGGRSIGRAADPSGAKEHRRAVGRELRSWIEEHWGSLAKIVLRGNRVAQESMAKQGWGPEAFYEPLQPTRGKPKDLVVLLFFDEEEVYSVFAYPMSRRNDIEWTPKPVGDNPAGRMTFDPASLGDVFKFESIEEFKTEFPRRFDS